MMPFYHHNHHHHHHHHLLLIFVSQFPSNVREVVDAADGQLFNQNKYSNSIGRVNTPTQLGTAFCFLYKGRECIFTNHHVIKTKTEAKDSFIEFGYLAGDALSINKVYLDPDSVFWTNRFIDATIVALKRGSGVRPLRINLDESLSDGMKVVVCGHPEGDPFTVSFGAICPHFNPAAKHRKGQIYYDVPTRHGSSGSPVISNDTAEVLGIHHKQLRIDETEELGKVRQGTSMWMVFKTLQDDEIDVSIYISIVTCLRHALMVMIIRDGQRMRWRRRWRRSSAQMSTEQRCKAMTSMGIRGISTSNDGREYSIITHMPNKSTNTSASCI